MDHCGLTYSEKKLFLECMGVVDVISYRLSYVRNQIKVKGPKGKVDGR